MNLRQKILIKTAAALICFLGTIVAARLWYLVLIHCKAGADRAGLAAALWKMAIDGAPKSEARRHLSIRYGHMPLGPTQALDAFLENWVIPTKVEMDAEKLTGALFNGSGYAAD